MFKQILENAATKKALKVAKMQSFNVTVIGAAGEIGQNLSLLLNNNESIRELRLYDHVDVTGVGTDLSHCDTPSALRSFTPDNMKDSLIGTDIVLISTGTTKIEGKTKEDLFEENAPKVAQIISNIVQYAPEVYILMVSKPINCLVPLAAEILKKKKIYNKKKLMGITKIHEVRASTFISEQFDVNPQEVSVPVVGGNSGETIVPIFSQTHLPDLYTSPHNIVNIHKLSVEDRNQLIHRVQFGTDEVIEAKNGSGTATLGIAYAAAGFTNKLIQGLEGRAGVNEVAYVDSNLGYERFFTSRILLGKQGIEEIFPLGKLLDYEEEMISKMLPTLKSHIDKGINFAHEF